ncbi:hypothetical protein A4V04_02035 [Burkholderiales bacterium YL45]|uniref:Uncharacterized protein n=2 Tax=Turicimonas muris TaxID=1796652 RepID=A0A227KRL5_9BURK|nr:hypothetical protein A4V04_02035 [Burkholderiales bacterium YL45]OXE51139.1 hypothetical protein ADH67_02275 [Turicimonas muris]
MEPVSVQIPPKKIIIAEIKLEDINYIRAWMNTGKKVVNKAIGFCFPKASAFQQGRGNVFPADVVA